MSFSYPGYPSVSAALTSSKESTFRGNTFGQVGLFQGISKVDIEIADNFDVHQKLQKALEERKKAGLDGS